MTHPPVPDDPPGHARPEDARLPLGPTFAYGFQHVVTMYGGVVAPALIVGGAAGLVAGDIGTLVSAALFVSGAATLLQTLGLPWFGAQLPLVQGISFAAVSTMVTVASGDDGLPAVLGAVMVAGLVGLAISPAFSRIVRLFPVVVTGSIITVIGISLLPVAVRWAMGGQPASADWGSPGNIGLAGFTLAAVLLLCRIARGALSRLSVLLGMAAGTALAWLVGKADFAVVAVGPVFAFPQPFAFGAPVFAYGAILSMVIVILVIMTETTADILAVGEIVGTRVDARRVADGLRADMLATALSPVFNSFPASAFAQNVGLVAMTGNKSRFVVAAGGVTLLALGLVPLLGRVVAAVPRPVLGGAGVVLFGTVAASGIRTLSKVDYDGTLNTVLVATALAFGVIPIAVPGFYAGFPDWIGIVLESGISAASLVAVLLNALFNGMGRARQNGTSAGRDGRHGRGVDMSTESPAARIEAEVASWDGVSVVPHRFGGREFRVGRRELGHLHGDRLADLPFPVRVRDELLRDARAERHHVLPDSGWVTLRLRQPSDVDAAIALFRLNYERPWLDTPPASAPVDPVDEASEESFPASDAPAFVPVTGVDLVTSAPAPEPLVVVHEAGASGGRFLLERDGRHLGELAYGRRGAVVVLVHTEVDPSLRGTGASRRLVDSAVDWARTGHLQLVPVCRFARRVLEGSPDYRDVLAPSRATP